MATMKKTKREKIVFVMEIKTSMVKCSIKYPQGITDLT